MVVKLLILFLLCHAASAVRHSLKYLITASSGDPNISEFMFVTVVDDTEVLHCDGSKKIFEPTQDWLNKVFDDSPDLFVAFTFECFDHQPNIFKSSISHLKQLLNQSEGVHILQLIGGCEWDEKSGEVKNFFQFGINGEDAFEFDLKTLTWIALKPELYYIKQILDGDTPGIKYIQEVISTFYSTLRLFWGYGSSSLNKTVVPSVSLLQKTPSSPVSCHATGFYPDRGAMFWRKDGVEIHEGVDLGEIIPNNDETFQMSVDLNVLSVTPEDWSRYDCVFQLYGVENIHTKLDRTVIRSNTRKRTENPSDMSAPSIAAVVVVLACILIAATGFAVYNKKKASENSIELSVRLP